MESNTATAKSLPQTGFVRLSDIIREPKKPTAHPGNYSGFRSTWLAGVKSGRFPKPVKLSPGIIVWRVEDIREFIHEYPTKSSL